MDRSVDGHLSGQRRSNPKQLPDEGGRCITTQTATCNNVPSSRPVGVLGSAHNKMRLIVAVLLCVAVLSYQVDSERIIGAPKNAPITTKVAKQPTDTATATDGQKQQVDAQPVEAEASVQRTYDGRRYQLDVRGDELSRGSDPASYQPSYQPAPQLPRQQYQSYEEQLDAYYRQHGAALDESYGYDALSSYGTAPSDMQYAPLPQKNNRAIYYQPVQQQPEVSYQPVQQQPENLYPRQAQQPKQQADATKGGHEHCTQKDKDPSCPTPQQADDVKQGMLINPQALLAPCTSA